MSRILRCYAEGREGSWEALCLDFNIAIQGDSFEEVSKSLKCEIEEYIEYAYTLPESERKDLLERKALSLSA